MTNTSQTIGIQDTISADIWSALQQEGWAIHRLHPFEGGEVLGRIVGDDILYMKPTTGEWFVARERISPKMHGREHWRISPLSLEDAILAVETLPELEANFSIHALTLEALMAQRELNHPMKPGG